MSKIIHMLQADTSCCVTRYKTLQRFPCLLLGLVYRHVPLGMSHICIPSSTRDYAHTCAQLLLVSHRLLNLPVYGLPLALRVTVLPFCTYSFVSCLSIALPMKFEMLLSSDRFGRLACFRQGMTRNLSESPSTLDLCRKILAPQQVSVQEFKCKHFPKTPRHPYHACMENIKLRRVSMLCRAYWRGQLDSQKGL